MSTPILYSFMSFSERIKKLRKYLGLSQKNFGEKIGVGTSHVSQWERDLSMPSSKALTGMANLGVNINWLLTGDGEMMRGGLFSPNVEGIFTEKQLELIEKLIDGKIDERFKRLLK
ncbi:MAG: helix-turn-helix domain-containing protein [Candidatus Aminicenantes bacterium]|nr:helix-turn-helix domain-containing protein [Candidatus Aminicenantes bacterium]